MLNITKDMTITMSYMENAKLNVSAKYQDGTEFVFSPGDVVRLKIWPHNIGQSWSYDATAAAESKTITITISELYTHFDETVFSKNGNPPSNWRACTPVEFLYSITLNPDTDPRVLVGYDNTGPKILRVYP